MSPTADDLFAFYCYFLSFGIFVLVRVLFTSHSVPTQSLVLATAVGTFSGRLDPLKVISRSGVSEVTVWTTLSLASSPSLLPREVSPEEFFGHAAVDINQWQSIQQSLVRCLRRSTSSGKLNFLGVEFSLSSNAALCLVRLRLQAVPLVR